MPDGQEGNGQVTGSQDDVVAIFEKKANRSVYAPPKFATKLEEREWVKHRLAQAYRIFGHLGYDEGVAGHITMRDPVDTNTFWVNPFGLHFSSIRAQDLLHVDHTGLILEDSGPQRILNKAAFMIHSTIHAKRPDVHCAAHSHSIYGRAFATLGIELDMLTQDSCAFYKDHAVYHNFRGVVLDEEEGLAIAEALGGRKAAILQNHGLLVATDSIESTVHFYIALEKSCQVQLLADAAARGRGIEALKITEEDAANTWKTVGGVKGGYFAGLPQFQALERREALLPPELRMDAPKYWPKHG
ncbi:class II aldolase/adducin domain-containing protein [Auricularia subglabra TFB-10046 SS5]|uniref:Class II aldolase/adducin domain-containing protein n=1 Tax=Auricularia subglabra (strain TFB-10046 / SS5) TaxID=717982 RepID=J0LKV9_AURST|nr:class II aldolase/adducin domain-containing protein [Auricularia subglabra TFB-10046 SS5]